MKNNAIVLYNSKTGFTQRYAELIGREVGCLVLPLRDAPADLSPYTAVVFGSRLHAGTFDGWKKVRALLAQRGAKKLVVFATGAMPNQAEAQIQKMWAQNLTAEERETVPHFYLQAGLCYEKMGGIDRAMMKFAAWAMTRRKDETPEDEAFQNAIRQSYDISGPEYIRPVVDCLGTLDGGAVFRKS